MATFLSNNPSLDRFRRDAHRLRRAVRADVPRAVRIVERLHPDGVPADRTAFTLGSGLGRVCASARDCGPAQVRDRLHSVTGRGMRSPSTT